jgi:hypothetical protein
MRKIVTISAVVLGVIVLAAGIASLVLGHTSASSVSNRLKQEKVSLRIFDTNAPADAIIASASDAQKASDTLTEHRRKIAPTYADLLGGKQFDPTNPKDLTYAQAMNLGNSLDVAVLAFGLTTVLTFNGVVFIVIGIALIVTSLAVWLYHMRRVRAVGPAS